jgi:hypothetical protein
MRVTRLDGCGNKVLGPKNSVTSDGFTTAALAANTDEGETIDVTNAAGKQCILDEPAPRPTGFTVTLTFCQVDPELYTLVTGQPVVYAADGTTPVGVDVNSDVDLSTSGFALELWSSVPSNACVGGVQEYGYFLLPFLRGGSLGDVSIENAAITFTINNAVTKDGNNWGVGPYNVVKNVSGVDSPLNVALSTKNHLHLEKTATAPPAAAGAAQLGVPATTAVAGIPATFTPTNSYAPLNLAGAIALPLVASPATNWTTGQYALMRDGSKINWNGTTWVAGVHA